MSLINDMLNDLDDRRSGQRGNEVSLDWMSGHKIHGENRWQLPLIACVVILIFIVIAYGVWSYQSKTSMTVIDKLSLVRSESRVVETLAAGDQQVLDAVAIDAEVNDKSVKVVNGSATATQAKKSVTKAEPPAVKKNTIPAEISLPTERKSPKSVQKIHVNDVVAAPIKTQKPLTLDQRDREQYQRAEMLLRQQRFTEAELLLQDFLSQYAQAPHSGELLVSLWISQQQWQQAQNLLTSLRGFYPQNIRLIMLDARLALQQKQTDKAVALLMSEQPVLSEHQDYYELLGITARQNKQYQLSAEVYRGLLGFDSQRGDWWVGMAIALEMQQQSSAARDAYRQALLSKNITPALRNYAQKKL
ncbi:lipopolysaccharide assembly protein LapB [Oceanicoccus sp. KOV_DT_Chl]|uniref:tetratricopeptide repeat protein n=1 Tax=Oceanicoccus sp. KOV_DT_Chl TaxID=1904639 RepID=UPI000C7B703A|nr:hypothetical protein [Oceanicoccus sp. KOV_DT_Chl]